MHKIFYESAIIIYKTKIGKKCKTLWISEKPVWFANGFKSNVHAFRMGRVWFGCC